MVTCFPSQTSSNLMIVTFAQSFWLGSRVLFIIVRPTVNFSEVIRLNVQIFCTFEVRPEVTNILVTRDNILHRNCIYLQKNESSIFKYNVKVFRNSPSSVSIAIFDKVNVCWDNGDNMIIISDEFGKKNKNIPTSYPKVQCYPN